MKRGFTLIEVVVVVGMIGVLLVGAIEIMLNSVKAKNKAGMVVRIDQVGNTVLSEMRRGLINSLGGNMSCDGFVGVGSSSVSYESIKDGQESVITCFDSGRIASASASYTINLTPDDIKAMNCQEFVSCSTLPSGGIGMVDIGFTLSMGSTEVGAVYAERSFRSKVTIRN